MRFVAPFLVLVVLAGCSGTKNKYKVEKSAILRFKESYHQKWVSGVRGGGSGNQIFLVLDVEKVKGVELKGIYFREKYALLKFHGEGKYQGFIKGESNKKAEKDMMVGTEKKEKKSSKEKQEAEFPFQLKLNEAVISFLHKGKLKYNKITITKKELLPNQIPR